MRVVLGMCVLTPAIAAFRPLLWQQEYKVEYSPRHLFSQKDSETMPFTTSASRMIRPIVKNNDNGEFVNQKNNGLRPGLILNEITIEETKEPLENFRFPPGTNMFRPSGKSPFSFREAKHYTNTNGNAAIVSPADVSTRVSLVEDTRKDQDIQPVQILPNEKKTRKTLPSSGSNNDGDGGKQDELLSSQEVNFIKQKKKDDSNQNGTPSGERLKLNMSADKSETKTSKLVARHNKTLPMKNLQSIQEPSVDGEIPNDLSVARVAVNEDTENLILDKMNPRKPIHDEDAQKKLLQKRAINAEADIIGNFEVVEKSVLYQSKGASVGDNECDESQSRTNRGKDLEEVENLDSQVQTRRKATCVTEDAETFNNQVAEHQTVINQAEIRQKRGEDDSKFERIPGKIPHKKMEASSDDVEEKTAFWDPKDRDSVLSDFCEKTQSHETKDKENEQLLLETKRENDELRTMIQKRRQQQAELERLEDDLFSKTNELRKTKEYLLDIEAQIKTAELNVKSQNGEVQDEFGGNEKCPIPHYSPKEYRSLSMEEKKQLKDNRARLRDFEHKVDYVDDDTKEKNPDHPILGPVIIDLGYKRIHLVSAGRLGTIPIWKKRGTYRNDRAHRMASEKIHHMSSGFPGIICLYEDGEGKLSIVDGQHRVGMMQGLRRRLNERKECGGGPQKKLNEFEDWNEDYEQYFENVLVEVYSDFRRTKASVGGNRSPEKLYLEINKAEPLPVMDIQGVASKIERNVIIEAVNMLRDQYKPMFSSSRVCRAPKVNMDRLRNSLFESNVLKNQERKFMSGKELLRWLIDQNSAIGGRYEAEPNLQKVISQKAWDEAHENGFYLGIDNSWLCK